MEYQQAGEKNKEWGFEFPLAILIIACSSCSVLLSIFVAIKMIFKKVTVTFSKELMIYLTLSEIINGLAKITLLHKLIPGSNDTFHDVVCQTQVVVVLLTDNITLINSTVLAIQICYSFEDAKKWFRQPNNKNIIRGVAFGVPSILTSVFIVLHFTTSFDSQPEDDFNKKTYIWCWVHPNYSMMIYGLYIIMVALIIIYSRKTIRFLKNQEQSLLLFIAEEEEGEYISDGQATIENVRYLLKKISFYPVISSIIWFFLFLNRLINFCLYLNAKIQNEEEDNWWEKVFIVLHAFISSSRGIFYGDSI